MMIGSVWLRAEPRLDSEMTGVTVDLARPVEILAVYKTWYLVRWPPGDLGGASGWVPRRWVGCRVRCPRASSHPSRNTGARTQAAMGKVT